MELPDGMQAILSVLNAESIGKGTELVISGGGFPTEEEAYSLGKVIKGCVLITSAKLRIGVDCGKDKANIYLNTIMKDDIEKANGIKLIDNVHGLSVYSEKHPVKTISSSGVRLVAPLSAEKFGTELYNHFSLSKLLSNKQSLALELYGASYFEKSERTRFLTLILGIEALLDLSDRSDKEKELIGSLVAFVKNAEIGNNERTSILGSLKWLYKQSISQSLQTMGVENLGDKTYGGLTAAKFIKKCYEARSSLVHTGSVNEDKVNIGGLAAGLSAYLSDLLLSLIEKNSP